MRSLSIIVCLLLAVAAIHADTIDMYLDSVKDEIMTCAKENGFTEQTAREIYDKDEASGVDNASCLRACVQKSMGILEDSKINLDKMNEYVQKVQGDHPDMIPMVKAAAADCVKTVEDITDECKMAYTYVQCFLGKH